MGSHTPCLDHPVKDNKIHFVGIFYNKPLCLGLEKGFPTPSCAPGESAQGCQLPHPGPSASCPGLCEVSSALEWECGGHSCACPGWALCAGGWVPGRACPWSWVPAALPCSCFCGTLDSEPLKAPRRGCFLLCDGESMATKMQVTGGGLKTSPVLYCFPAAPNYLCLVCEAMASLLVGNC